jgi:hypothetical protein
VIIGVAIMLVNWRKLLSEKNTGLLFLLLLLVISIIGIEGNMLPVKLFPHRFWVLLAIPVAAIAAETIVLVSRMVPQRAIQWSIIILLTAIVLWNCLPARIAVQQAGWPPGVAWTSQEELAGYVSLPDAIPTGSRVLALCSPDSKVIGNNMAADPWSPARIEQRENLGQKSAQDIIAFMESENYQYIVLDSTCISKMGINHTQELADNMSKSMRFIPMTTVPGFVMARLA